MKDHSRASYNKIDWVTIRDETGEYCQFIDARVRETHNVSKKTREQSVTGCRDGQILIFKYMDHSNSNIPKTHFVNIQFLVAILLGSKSIEYLAMNIHLQ